LHANEPSDGYFGGGRGNIQTATPNISNISIDPLDENYFASAGAANHPSITVWDKRWISHSSPSASNNGAVFNFNPAFEHPASASVWSLRYSGSQKGRLAVFSNIGELRVIDMAEGPTSAIQTSDYLPNNPYGGTSWHANRYVSQTRVVLEPEGEEGTKPTSGFIAFDWTNDAAPGTGQALLTLWPDREAQIQRVPVRNPNVEVTSRQDLSIGLEQLSLTEARPYTTKQKPGAPYEQTGTVGAAEDFGPLDYNPEASLTDLAEVAAPLQCSLDSPTISKLLASATVQRERCLRGYLWDCEKNTDIVKGNWQLERLWEIVDRFREQVADDGMVYQSLDLSYIGVSGLWSDDLGNERRRRISATPLISMTDAILGLHEVQNIPPFDGERTDFPEHRQMCLAVCGWKFTTETLEKECQELIDRGLYYQAIVQAVLHDYRHIALNLLRTLIRSKTIPNIGLGALLASDEINKEQREMCLWMAADTEDPALKALLTFLETGDWRDVMKTNYLHLGYRVALGLKYLNDTELSGFIESETARAIRNGDLEGILLTGLGEQAMDLCQTYIAKTNDLQTAVLATAYTNPLYVDDMRWEMWKETYCMQMQSWQAFPQRAKFAVQHAQLARRRDGRTMVQPPEKQAELRCNHCNGPLGRRSNGVGGGGGGRVGTEGGRSQRITGPSANAGTVCPSCGRHMPRCGICQHWLGTPDPRAEKTLSRKSKADGKNQSAETNENTESKERVEGKVGELMAKFLSFCVSCGHCFHAHHAKMWFEKHDECPVVGCGCRCVCKVA
jgi:WD repeat-containing protein mio